MINNRQQAGRRRGRGGNGNGNGGGGGPRPQGGGARDTGNRIDNRARGNASQLHEKYKNLARDAQMQGDRVNTEYYLQFADHYFRVLSETRNRFEENQPRRQQNDALEGSFDRGFDGDDEYGDEGEPIRAGEQAQGGDRQPPRDQVREQQDGQQRYARNGNGNGNVQDGGEQRPRFDRVDRPRDATGQGEDRRPRADREAGQQDGGERRPRIDRDGQQDARPRTDRDGAQQAGGERRPRVDRQRTVHAPEPVAAEPAAAEPAPSVVEAIAAPAVEAPELPLQEAAPEAPRRRGRPRREVAPVDEIPAAFEVDRLPPSLGISAVASNDVDVPDEPKPRRRRVRTAPPEASAAE